jgi:hypothetical protein
MQKSQDLTSIAFEFGFQTKAILLVVSKKLTEINLVNIEEFFFINIPNINTVLFQTLFWL